jgi:menaquinone-dependent protoporphyrinogen IX oxidase
MKKILVTYATLSGTTADVAAAIADELTQSGAQVEVLPLAQVGGLDGYAAVILGAPMIMGWHRQALDFLKKNRAVFQHLPLALFVTAMSLTSTAEKAVDGVPIFIDEAFAQPPQKPGRLTFRERYAQVTNYAAPILKAALPAKPISLAFFGGRLDFYRLKWYAILFVMLVIQAQPGERRNWEAIRSWARGLQMD